MKCCVCWRQIPKNTRRRDYCSAECLTVSTRRETEANKAARMPGVHHRYDVRALWGYQEGLRACQERIMEQLFMQAVAHESL